MADLRNLVTIGNYAMPECSTFKPTTATLVNRGRNANGVVIGARVRNDISKIEMTWKFLYANTWSQILQRFASNWYGPITFYDQVTNSWITKTMYVGDRSAEVFLKDPATGTPLGFINCSFSLIEM